MTQAYTPQGKGDLEFISDRRLSNIWAFYTTHSLLSVLTPGFFDEYAKNGLKPEDKLELVADVGSPMACHAVLLVTEVDERRGVRVSLLVKYERTPVSTGRIDVASSVAPQAGLKLQISDPIPSNAA